MPDLLKWDLIKYCFRPLSYRKRFNSGYIIIRFNDPTIYGITQSSWPNKMIEWSIKGLIGAQSRTTCHGVVKAIFHCDMLLIYGALSRIQKAEVGFGFANIASRIYPLGSYNLKLS